MPGDLVHLTKETKSISIELYPVFAGKVCGSASQPSA